MINLFEKSHQLKLSLKEFTLESSVKTVDLSNAGIDPLLRFHIVLQADLGVLESRVAVVVPPVELHHLFVLKVYYATERSEENVNESVSFTRNFGF